MTFLGAAGQREFNRLEEWADSEQEFQQSDVKSCAGDRNSPMS